MTQKKKSNPNRRAGCITRSAPGCKLLLKPRQAAAAPREPKNPASKSVYCLRPLPPARAFSPFPTHDGRSATLSLFLPPPYGPASNGLRRASCESEFASATAPDPTTVPPHRPKWILCPPTELRSGHVVPGPPRRPAL